MMHPCLTRPFYEHLAWQLSGALSRSADKSLRRYWCDGILDPQWAEDYQPQYVRHSRRILLRAIIDQGPDKGGGGSVQSTWPLSVNLGPQAYQAYLQGRSLKPYVPVGADAWVLLAPQKQRLEVRLL